MQIQENLNHLRKILCKYLDTSDSIEWEAIKVEINFPPYINRGLRLAQYVEDKNGQKLQIRLMTFDPEIYNAIYNFIFKFNQETNYNQMIFIASKDKLNEATIKVIFNKEVEDAFENNLPKSIRGKTIPWWKKPEETKDLA
jgi:hypothetical protein